MKWGIFFLYSPRPTMHGPQAIRLWTYTFVDQHLFKVLIGRLATFWRPGMKDWKTGPKFMTQSSLHLILTSSQPNFWRCHLNSLLVIKNYFFYKSKSLCRPLQLINSFMFCVIRFIQGMRHVKHVIEFKYRRQYFSLRNSSLSFCIIEISTQFIFSGWLSLKKSKQRSTHP